ncbi:RHS repeat-associated core domain-containing protein [Ascidiimonas aurantiaca]|uniref:RHS repeat domain-containing protein n=1 Tax=Ascidiimonas aurantiaca TaxID=1685432 RepID=UPI0030EC0FFD
MKPVYTLSLVFLSLLVWQENHAQELPPFPNDNMNWSSTISFDFSGATVSKNVNYFDVLAKPVQSQQWDVLTGKYWINGQWYDAFGRPALQSLSAPFTASGFAYRPNVLQNTGGNPYALVDFDGPATVREPSPAGTAANTIGRYYSALNTGQPLQDITAYPFSRTVYSRLNPQQPHKVLGGNKVNKAGTEQWVQPYTFTMAAGFELTRQGAFNDPSYSILSRKVFKTVSRDVHGVENVVFTDSDGNTLATARSPHIEGPVLITDPNRRPNSAYIKEQGYVDVHIPEGSGGLTIVQPFQGPFPVWVYDLITEERITGDTSNLPPGFYRIAVVDRKNYNPATPVRIDHFENYYDYSLNFYDRAGRLTESRQPLQHLSTTFQYNSLGQLLETTSPDEGTAQFKYRRDGQIRYSQNSKQLAAGEFSYTNYDALGRPVESGVLVSTAFATANPDTSLPAGTRKEQQFTVFDSPDIAGLSAALGSLSVHYPAQSFVAGNVVKTYTQNPATATTWYSYDVYGRVVWMVQQIEGLGIKTIDYEYDATKGLVSKVIFQKHSPSEYFEHRYQYNNASQLVMVETSVNGTTYTVHAQYEYYENGALKRTELAPVGGQPLQGIDYVYNMAGQLKGINHPSLAQSKDPGGDTNDFFGMALDYHNNDYLRNNGKVESTTYGTNLFNGNIKGVRWNNTYRRLTGAQHTYSYQYDRNNWLTDAYYGQYSDPQGTGGLQDHVTSTAVVVSGQSLTLEATVSITLSPGFHAQNGSTVSAKVLDVDGFIESSGNDYRVSGITYDANGNIQTLNRNQGSGSGSNAMDQLTYTYKTDKPNQLLRVDDAVTGTTNADDIKDQDGNNYVYNSIGQLVQNTGEGITYIYNTSGLVTEIQKNTVPLVKFYYNDRGHRVRKESYNTTGSLIQTEYYVRDASGTTLAVYRGSTPQEYTVYGSGRLGVYFKQTGASVYQLTDHLGNVRALVGWTGSNRELKGATDYYPFGMVMPHTQLTDGTYRYGYQGQEKDPETGLSAFQLRMYDTRIGRWISPDPYGEFFSPYLAMANNPASVTDPDGGCTTKGGRPCAFSILGGTATDFQGKVWFGTGDVPSELLTPISLNEVTVFDNRNFLQKFRGKTTRASREFFKPVRDFRREYAENAAIMREVASEIARENIGSVYRAGAEIGLVGSGLGFGPSRIGNFVQSRKVNTIFGKAFHSYDIRQTRNLEKGVRINFKDGSVLDITADRVKGFIPNNHPKAPVGTLQRVKFDNSIPGSKGYKRLPTNQELSFLNNL